MRAANADPADKGHGYMTNTTDLINLGKVGLAKNQYADPVPGIQLVRLPDVIFRNTFFRTYLIVRRIIEFYFIFRLLGTAGDK